jgi:hypothetical protein
MSIMLLELRDNLGDMSEELLRETNELMKRLLELRAQDAVERESQKVESEKTLAEIRTRQWSDEFKVPNMSNFQSKHEAELDEIKKKGEEAQLREINYREELLGELRRQNELLEQIAEQLGR